MSKIKMKLVVKYNLSKYAKNEEKVSTQKNHYHFIKHLEAFKHYATKNKTICILYRENTGICATLFEPILDEPIEVGGLAHFCEHMMALGSKKYPSENLYKFTAGKNGGKTNAFTANESTAYQFGDNSNIK